ncbi:pyridoxamine 5'-phosphate oxidase [uncultured Bacteroides sp.]|uniref:pyridoxamine 5'-phosphate oxidase n=1 Tax=uncultured Bacteroides sp. TaxID=162156 RepID=UPI002AA778DF|nr:pyridoxamine 5'-phosphate oxidase [uncultured Bacteroides sp.]
MKIDIHNIRREYSRGGLARKNLSDNPLIQFQTWLEEAISAEVNEPTAVIVGTVSEDGKPSTRCVLLKELRDEKFVFYTNYESRKGKQLANSPYISLTFLWHELERQVHVEGIATKLPPEVSDEYFKTRPYKSRIGARISPQSQPIAGRMEIMQAFIRESIRFAGHEVKRPDNWGGYAVSPTRIEFWQGRESRLHDRFLYTLQSDQSWKIERLAP